MHSSRLAPALPMPHGRHSALGNPNSSHGSPDHSHRSLEEVADWVQGKSNKRKSSEPPELPAKKRRHNSVEPPLPLTRRALRQLDRADVPRQKLDEMDSQSSITNDSSGVINAYSSSFPEELRRRRIYMLEEDSPLQPENFHSFRAATSIPRASPEPDEEDTVRFRRRVLKSVNEAAAVQSLLPKLLQLDHIWDSKEFMTVPNQPWDRKACIPLLPGSSIPVPKPDQTVGWRNTVFPMDKALAILRPFAAPITQTSQLLFPYFIVEAKGDAGNLKISRLQNASNAAVMLFDLWRVRKEAGRELEFWNKIHVVTMCLTTESLELSYHWATMVEGQICFYCKVFDCWSLNNKSSILFNEARRAIRSAFEWISSETRRCLESDLALLEERLDLQRTAGFPSSDIVTPPDSQTEAMEKRKRPLSKAYQVGKSSRSRSSASDQRHPHSVG